MPLEKKTALEPLPNTPGVYSMLDKAGNVLYVGKARDLKKRVCQYFNHKQSGKNKAMIAHIDDIRITVTRTEKEALILENNLIKKLKPRYNILFKDDKSYPYILIALDHPFPRISYHRGAKTAKGKYFGPFPGAGAVRKTLGLLQKLFLIRPCEDSVFSHRSRPCLQYQIKRCTAPCVGYIEQSAYQQQIEHAILFLDGKNEAVIQALTGPMYRAANALQFEQAAQYRDQISNLRKLQETQYISHTGGNFDIIVCAENNRQTLVEVSYIRGGLHLGNKTYFPQNGKQCGDDYAQLLSSFITQCYLKQNGGRDIPHEIIVDGMPKDRPLIESVLSERAGYSVKIKNQVKGVRARWRTMALQNANLALKKNLVQKIDYPKRFAALNAALNREEQIERIECFDISHTQGEATIASCVVFGIAGPINKDYRKFNVKNITGGDDYAAMRQAIKRRYTRLIREQLHLPDLILIDGGKGQLNAAKKELSLIQQGHILVVGIAKGPARKPGMESIIVGTENRLLKMKKDAIALHLIQQIRDEAHRFAIGAHRKKRATKYRQSSLEEIVGIGAKRRKNLLQYFGGMQEMRSASVEDLVKVPHINKKMAEKIHHHLHDGR